ncbi:MAG: ABC transporter substrate-binding protein [Alcaligenaceae bacterium]|nr:ABC transporter substrate-binding protein [Alcaligenaceae bacterium SAGV5]MPS53157.1 ABC transporter substrate-binding protein [Alcaligenaceae bacterium SAGV3]MPT55405.1 ABC transporter substrate-binding protein [Alcaligenaceae bacterium]
MKHWIRTALATTLLSATLPALAQDKVIRIGVIVPISGPASYFGVPAKQAMEMAVDELNKTGVNGYKFQLQVEDGACSPLQSTNVVKKLIDEYKPQAMIGEWCSDAALAIAPIQDAAKIPTINVTSAAVRLTESGYKNIFRIFPNADMQNARLAKFAAEQIKAKTAVILYEKTNAGLDNANAFEKDFIAAGGKVLARIDFGKDVNDFTPIATRVASLGKIDVLPTYGLEGQVLRLTQSLAQVGVTKGGGGTAVPMGTIFLPYGFDKKAGPSSVGYVRIVQFDPTEKRAVVQNFVNAFKARYGAAEIPSHINAHSYDAVMLIADAVRRGGTTSDGIRERLAQTNKLELTTGFITFDAKGQNIDPSTMHFVETNPDYSWKSLAY